MSTQSSSTSPPEPLVGSHRTKPLAWLETRFGIPPSVFDAYTLYRPRGRDIVVLKTSDVPLAPTPPLLVGMTLLRMNGRLPKPTTEAAMMFGAHATNHIVGIDQSQATAFIHYQAIAVTADQTSNCTSKGYVLVRFGERTLGVGFFHPAASGGTVDSLFPKAWGGVQMKQVVIPGGTGT